MFDLMRYGEDTALVDEVRSYSYAELRTMSEEVANAVGARTLVFVLCENCVESLAGYVGFVNAGIVPLLLDVELDDELLANLVQVYRPTHIWAPTESSPRLEGYGNAYSLGCYSLFGAKRAEAPELHPELALLMSTSGSTGTPKVVRLSLRNIASNADSISEYLGITPRDRAITSLPMSYVYGLSVINSHLKSGASLALTKFPCYTGGFWKQFGANACSSFAGVPFMYEMLDKLKFTTKPAPDGLKSMTQAGGRLSPALQRKFAEFAAANGIDFFVMYGASEATARMAYLPPSRALEKEGSIGIAIPGGHFEIVDSEGAKIDICRTPGELVYYGDNVSLGYAQGRNDLSKGDEREGRLPTGDIAEFDEDGYYYIVGRMKRFVKMLGKRMNLDEVEQLLKRELDTLDVACTGKDDSLQIFLADEGLVEQAQALVMGTLKVNPRMFEVRAIGSIPKNPSGKTLYGELEKL